MKKRMIKLINDERTRASLTAQKGCGTISTDRCYSEDLATCTTYAYDQCDKDYAACIKGARDICTTDHAGCVGNGVIDSCNTDYYSCHSSGGADYN